MTEALYSKHFHILAETMTTHWFLLLLVFAIALYLLVYSVSLPKHFPRSIPTVSIYAQVYDALRGVSKVNFYNARIRKHSEKHGAVGLWQDGEWTALLTKPEYLTQMFRDKNDSLKRNGAYLRVPRSPVAQLFGENIVDSDGDLHNQFRNIIKPGIGKRQDIASIKVKSFQLASQLLRDQMTLEADGGIPVSVPVFQWSASICGEYFLDLELDSLEFSESNIQAILGVQNSTVIGKVKSIFPVLDRLPWTWNITRRTSKLFDKFEAMLVEHASRRLAQPPSPGGEDRVIYHMSQAHSNGTMSEFHYRSNMKQLFVAGTENVESALISAMLELAKNQTIQERLHFELGKTIPAEYSLYSEDDLNKAPLLTAVIYETLRLHPPGPITNRRTKEPYSLGDNIVIPAGTLIGRHIYGIHTNPEVWGDSAADFDPDRWGKHSAAINSMFRLQQIRGKFIPFGLYARRCLGSSFAITQLKIALCELIRTLKWTLPADQHNCTFVFNKRA